MQRFLLYLLKTVSTKESYAALFKAGFALLAASAVSLTQVGPQLAKQDSDYWKLRYAVETKARDQQEPANCRDQRDRETRADCFFESIDCSKLSESQADCLFAKHEGDSIKRYRGSFNWWFNRLQWGGLTLLLFSVAAFLIHPILHQENA
jgi:hypothetical protein